MEKRIYRSLCITAISAVLLSVAFSIWVFYDFYAQQAETGIVAEFTAMAVATLPAICLIILVILCGCMYIASCLTRSIVEPIEQLADSLPDKLNGPGEREYYPELCPFIEKITHQQQQLEEQRLLDITELERVDGLRREFSANVSHELKTPITSISGFAEMIENGMAATPEDCRIFAGRIVKESSRLLSLVEDIIHLSRLDEHTTMEVVPCQLSEIVEENLQYLRPIATRQQVTLSQEGASPLVMGSRSILSELVQNLCENAIKYNRVGGTVLVRLSREGDFAVMRVIDNGIGIAPEHHDRVFQRFYRVDKSRSKQTGGTGLGLSIAKHITEQHGGDISIRSALGVGTELTVRIPAVSEQSPAT
ncbi:MAG: ATP-binding protein [Angelakisella sp.]